MWTCAIYFREKFDHYRWSWTNNAFSIIDSSVTSTTAGVYGQLDYRLTDKLTATAGLRYSRETSELDSLGYASNVTGAELALRYAANGLEKDWTAVQPKVSLSYQWTPGVLTYATYSQGSTAGGYNSAAATLAVAQTPVDPDEINAYEIGLKTFGWGGRLSTSTAVFYNDFKDYQATISNPIIDGQLVPGAVFANAGRAHTFGVEVASTAKLSRALEASLSLAYLTTEFDEYLNPTGAANSNFVNFDLPNSPKLSGGLRLNYDVPLSSGANWSTTGAVRYEDESYSAVSADRELTKQPAQTYVDAGVYFTTASRQWTFSFAGTNLLDRDYGLPGSYTPSLGFKTVLWNRERQLTLGVRRDFF
ncbi:TonB-dependent receptor [Steroidobacter sp.]|uniref:TonB-dependent receptor n=1 Tax=Steroidobacter sp. TaxID=1978227 RepID=UPI001A426DCC|nr:TonB-dependent receptor [Steroidobacter sp.]MBL8267095.1 TonB-dependent receptor [Steroidobacter sp.]